MLVLRKRSRVLVKYIRCVHGALLDGERVITIQLYIVFDQLDVIYRLFQIREAFLNATFVELLLELQK